jgi:ATP-binding cassette subfamily B multidrug efflux pump
MPLTTVLGNFFRDRAGRAGRLAGLRNLVSVGIIATFISYGQNFTNPLRQLANLYNSIQAALAGAPKRVFEIIDTPSEVDDGPEAVPLESVHGDVRFEHVNFGIPPGFADLKDMTWRPSPGRSLPWSVRPAPARPPSSTC